MSFNHAGQYAQQSFSQFEVELTGIWATPQTTQVDASLNGSERILMFGDVNATQNAGSFISGRLLDSKFWPLKSFKEIIAIFDNTIVSTTPGVITVNIDGTFIISPLGGLYSGTAGGGFPAFVVKYITTHP